MNYSFVAQIRSQRPESRPGLLCLTACILVAPLLLNGCAGLEPEPPRRTSHHQPYRQFGKWYTPLTDSTGFTQTGIASWYGNKFHGNKTASGEVYDMYAMTAAHKTLPLGTYVKVVNLDNDRSAVVRVNDRGPFVDGRVIDLSYLAASKIGIAQCGTGRVRLEALGKDHPQAGPSRRELAAVALPPDAEKPYFTLQMGSFTNRQNAVNLREALTRDHEPARIVIFHDGGRTFYRVRLGRYATQEEGERARQKMLTEGFRNVKVLTGE